MTSCVSSVYRFGQSTNAATAVSVATASASIATALDAQMIVRIVKLVDVKNKTTAHPKCALLRYVLQKQTNNTVQVFLDSFVAQQTSQQQQSKAQAQSLNVLPATSALVRSSSIHNQTASPKFIATPVGSSSSSSSSSSSIPSSSSSFAATSAPAPVVTYTAHTPPVHRQHSQPQKVVLAPQTAFTPAMNAPVMNTPSNAQASYTAFPSFQPTYYPSAPILIPVMTSDGTVQFLPLQHQQQQPRQQHQQHQQPASHFAWPSSDSPVKKGKKTHSSSSSSSPSSPRRRLSPPPPSLTMMAVDSSRSPMWILSSA